MIYFCNLCKFQVPADEIGGELMKAHLKDQHGEPKAPSADPTPHR